MSKVAVTSVPPLFSKTLDVVIKSGTLSLVEFMLLLSVNKALLARYGDLEERLAFVVVMQRYHCQNGGQWDRVRCRIDQYCFWQGCLLTPVVCQSLEDRYGSDITRDPVSFYMRVAEAHADATCRSAGQIGEIMRDVRRTFPAHPFFHRGSRGNRILGRVLRAFATMRPDIGYCQGMNFVVGVLILSRLPIQETGGYSTGTALAAHASSESVDNGHGESDSKLYQDQQQESSVTSGDATEIESHATANVIDKSDEESSSPVPTDPDELRQEMDILTMLLALVDESSNMNMSGMWMPGVPKMKLRVFQFDRLFKSMIPRLHAHFERLKLAPEVLVAQWIITLFSYTVPLPMTMGLWNYIMIGGWAAVYRICLTILYFKEEELLLMEIDEIGRTMREWKGTQIVSGVVAKNSTSLITPMDWELFLVRAHKVAVTEEVLVQLHEQYGLELIFIAENQDLFAQFKANHLGQSEDRTSVAPPRFSRDSSSSSQNGISSRTRDLEPASLGWFERYGENLSPVAQFDMTFLAEELRSIDVQVEKDKHVLQKKIMETCELMKRAENNVRAAIKKQAKLQLRIRELESFIEETVQRSEKISYYVSVLLSTSGNVSLDPPTLPSSPEKTTTSTSEMVHQNHQNVLLEEMEGFSSELLDEASDSESSHSRLHSEATETADTVITNDGALELEDSSQGTDREDGTDEPSPMYLRRFRKKLIKSYSLPKESIVASDIQAADKSGDSSSTVETKIGGGSSLISSFIRSIASPFSKASPVEASSLTNNKGKGRGVIAPMGVGDERAKQKALMNRILLFSKQSSKCQNDIIDANRRLFDLKIALSKAEKAAQSTFIAIEDANTQKKSLCEQLQLLGHTANRERSEKLQFAANVYGT